MREDLDTLIQLLGRKYGLENLHLDEKNQCAIEIEGIINVTLEYVETGNRINLYSPITDVSMDEPIEIYQYLLQANAFWQKTGGATIGITPIERVLVMSISYSVAELTSDSFY